MLLTTCLDTFIGQCRLKDLSPRTIEAYDSFVMKFIKYTTGKNIQDLNLKLINEYINYLYSCTLSKATVGTYIRHLKIFIKYLEEEELIAPFSSKIKVPKLPKKLLDIYSDEEIKYIFKNINAITPWMTFRDLSIVALFIDSGVRLNEVCKLNITDIDFRNNFIKVLGKGNKERLVPIGMITRKYILKYLKIRPEPYDHEALFISFRDLKRIDRNAIRLFVNKLSRKLGFEFSPHKLRHNFATNYCIAEYTVHGRVDIYKLMIILGHEDTLTTQKYLHFAQQVIVAKSNVSKLDKLLK